MTTEALTLRDTVVQFLRGTSDAPGVVDPLSRRDSSAAISAWIHGDYPREDAALPRIGIIDQGAVYASSGIGLVNQRQDAYLRVIIRTKQDIRSTVYGGKSGIDLLHALESRVRAIMEDTTRYPEWAAIGWTVPISVGRSMVSDGGTGTVTLQLDYRFITFSTG
jgi:hypothetical protein